MDERGYSRPLDVHRISEYPEVQRMINSLFEEMKSAGLIGKSPRQKILKHLKVVVLDCSKCAPAGHFIFMLTYL